MVRNTLARWWNQYKYRFVPWIALNLKERSLRVVPTGEEDKLVKDDVVNKTLRILFTSLESHDKQKPPKNGDNLMKRHEVVQSALGFSIHRKTSSVAGGGTGVFVLDGVVPEGAVVAMYPGAIYLTHEPVFFQSIGNPFIFKCIDSILIDGNDKGLSKFLYRSCSQRDRLGPYFTCDMSWLTEDTWNPLAVGQYVNNHNKSNPANVAYQEYDVPLDFPFELRKYIPNVFYSSSLETTSPRKMRTVVLVSTREIQKGEELFSSYFTVVH